MKKKNGLSKYYKPENYFNRDLSWIEFNQRVLEEAYNPALPLLEKIKFVSIFCSNLDEFYMIRVSGIKEQIAAEVPEVSIDGLNPRKTLIEIENRVQPLIKELSRFWLDEIVPQLKENNIFICNYDELDENEQIALKNYFEKQIFPVLTPLASDPGRPFPYISNLSLSLAVLVQDSQSEIHFARIKVPAILPRLLRVDEILHEHNQDFGLNEYPIKFMWIEDLIKPNLSRLFPKMKVLESHAFRITRDTDIEIQEDEADDLLKVIEENIKQRKFGNVVRMEASNTMPDSMIKMISKNLQITKDDVHIIEGPLGLGRAMEFYSLPLYNLKEKPHYPVIPKQIEEEANIFAIIRKKDVILHHPYHSFMPVINFIKQASKDPDVLAIKQTLYRVGQNSPVVDALIEAAEMKKQVAVLVELKARFDEENNIYWAKQLEKVGVHVVYGLVGLKTHAKLSLVVRREQGNLIRYGHIGTGNYNASTAKLYTDIGLFTCDEAICSDIADVFNFLTGYSDQKEFNRLLVAPVTMRGAILDLIKREITNTQNGYPSQIIMKINSLVDSEIIAALYDASNHGVKIDLIIRGICCLVPGVENLSENISVRSVVGRFLEHSRIFYFSNGGSSEVYIGSADMMSRNLNGRVETLTPVRDLDIKEYLVKQVLAIYLKDNEKARTLSNTMGYSFVYRGEDETIVNAQEWLMENSK
ncbi:MAG: polyphosphate kinase 1 [Ignavibacteriaceae bacterium]|nr:polyphosphate kinase 1 [Ignavibacteriaceae bacterium]